VILPNGTANKLYEYFEENSDGWKKLEKINGTIDHTTANELVDTGNVIMVAAYKNSDESKSGHVALVVPSANMRKENVIQIEQNFWNTGIVERPNIESFYQQFRRDIEQNTDIFYRYKDNNN
jgi:hypothetical protein